MSTPPTPATPSASESGSSAIAPRELRLARPEELQEVGRLIVRVYVGDGHIDAADDYVARLLDTRGRSSTAEIWVAAQSGRLLGSVTYCPVGSSYREIGRAGEGEFRMLAVAPEARGQGVGRALVELCVGRSRDLGYAGVRMSTMARMTAAHRVYERLGFERAPEDDWSPTPGMHLISYALDLGAQEPGTRERNLSASTTTRVTSPDPTSLPS